MWYNIAIIKDINQGLFTIDGNTNEAKPYDGATFVNPIIMYLENNSLNEARAGIDKKQFVHFYDEMTGSGGIIKTAGRRFCRSSGRNQPEECHDSDGNHQYRQYSLHLRRCFPGFREHHQRTPYGAGVHRLWFRSER